MKISKQLLLNSLLIFHVSAAGWALSMAGGSYEISKDLVGAIGPEGSPTLNSTDYSMAFAAGEPCAGAFMSASIDSLSSGYFSGRFGNSQSFHLLSSTIGQAGSKMFFQNNLRVGVPVTATAQLIFSDPVDVNSLSQNIQAVMVMDHLGTSTGGAIPVLITTDTTHTIVTLQPLSAWPGNSLYDIQVNSPLLNVDGVPLDQAGDVYFLTMLDQHQDNKVLDPISIPTLPAATGTGPIQPMSIQIPADSLANYSAVLSSRDPLLAPLHVDPAIIREANAKAAASGGAYQVPLALQEIKAYDISGNSVSALFKPATLTIDYGGGYSASGTNAALVRPDTLSLYVLDETHRLWVKMPASQNATGVHTVSAPVTQFSVFALMGSGQATSSDSFVFPVPWRPHGPKAGTGSGQTGTEADGLTFSSLPPECTITIYTITGEKVRQIHHSDTSGPLGQEKWDARTTHGDSVASGVYLWRVESSVDGKNGKLMIIR